MKVGLELFDLIKSLTVGENSIVRRNLPPKKDAFYGVFRKMEVYDAAVVKSAFTDMTDANIATTEHQLIDTILKLLWNSAPKHGMRDLVLAIGEVEILARKRLHRLALVKVENTIKTALELDAMTELLKGLRLKKEVMDVLRNAEPTDEEDLSLARWASAQLVVTGKYEELYSVVASLRNATPHRKAEIIGEAEALIEQLPKAELKKNKVVFHWCIHLLEYTKGNFNTATENATIVVEIMDKHDGLFADVQLRGDYFWALHYLIVYDTEEGRADAAKAGLVKFERKAIQWIGSIGADPNLHARFTHASLWAMLCAKDWEAVKYRVRQILKEVVAPGSTLLYKHKPVWLRMTLLAAFVVRDYSLVRRLCVELRKSVSEAYLASSFVTSIALFQLAAIYEERDDFLSQAVVNARVWLKEMKCAGPFEATMLEFFEQAGRLVPAPMPGSLLLSLKSRLELLFEDRLLWQHRELFPVMQWIQAQLSGIALREVIFP